MNMEIIDKWIIEEVIKEAKESEMKPIHQPIVEACTNPCCPRIINYAPPGGEFTYEACSVYLDPEKIQCRMGKTNACGVKPVPEPEKKTSPGMAIKRKFGKRTRG